LRLLRRAERKHEPKRDAALVLRFERTADIAQRPFFIRKDLRDAAHECGVQRRRLAGQGFRQDGGGGRLRLYQLRHRMLLCRRMIL